MTDIRHIDISGTIYKITKEVLLKSGYFSNLLAKDPTLGTVNPYYICRASVLFDHVLAYMINSNYLYPEEVEDEVVFFGLKSTTQKRKNLRGKDGRAGPPGPRGSNSKVKIIDTSSHTLAIDSVPENPRRRLPWYVEG